MIAVFLANHQLKIKEKIMECPYCEQELEWCDYFGNLDDNTISGIKKKGDVYKCPNEKCESETFNYYFYTILDDNELREGYPC